jgi:hypothetical protein
MIIKKQVPKRVTSKSVKKKPAVKKAAKKLPNSSVKSKKQAPLTASKKTRVSSKNKSNQQNSITKIKSAPKLASALKIGTKKITPGKHSNRTLKKTIETEGERALQQSVMPLIENLILERIKLEKTSQAGALASADRDNALVNTLIVSVSKLQDAIERLSTSIEQKLIQAKPQVPAPQASAPAPQAPAQTKPAPAPQAPAQTKPAPAPQASAPAPQAPAQTKPAEVKPVEVKPAPAPQASAPSVPSTPAPQSPAQAKPE